MYRTHYRPRYNITSQVTRSSKPRQTSDDLVITAEVVWAAAAYADRTNGGQYRKEPEYRVTETNEITRDIVRDANKVHMWQAIRSQDLITDEDLCTGRLARDWVRKNLLIKSLKGNMSDFDNALIHSVGMDEFMTGADRYEIALVTSQIRAWREGTRMESLLEDVDRAPVADVGDKVSLNVQVVKTVFSANFNVYFITAKTDQNQMVFFSYREGHDVGQWLTIRGTVKAHRPDATQLNRVKVL